VRSSPATAIVNPPLPHDQRSGERVGRGFSAFSEAQKTASLDEFSGLKLLAGRLCPLNQSSNARRDSATKPKVARNELPW